MKLSAWAKSVGISYRTAWRWYTEGKLPVEAEKTPTGTILIKEHLNETQHAIIYARDVNAAKNLLRCYTGSSPGIYACGDSSGGVSQKLTSYGSMKQEITSGIFVHKL